jgi:hypothetical protein
MEFTEENIQIISVKELGNISQLTDLFILVNGEGMFEKVMGLGIISKEIDTTVNGVTINLTDMEC